MAAAITVVCPKCENRMRASSEHVGRQGRCPNCKALVDIQPVEDPQAYASLYPESMTTGPARLATALAATDVPFWQVAALGTLVAAVLYGAVFVPLRDFHVGELFLARGVMPYITTLVTCWGLALLALKFRAVKKQMSYAERELEFIPLNIGVQITPTNVEQFLEHVAQLPAPQRFSILGRRIHGALDHFRSRNSVPEVQQYLTTQAEIDASQLDSGYTLLKAMIWAVPILGFIGTVMGISMAVTGLDVSLAKDATSTGLLDGMKIVTAGLSEAFDTTLIALSMAILLLFPTESLRKSEYRMLDRIEAFTNESLLRRMSDKGRHPADDDLPDVVRDALDAAFQEHQRWLAQWQVQVGKLGESIGIDFAQGFDSLMARLDETVDMHARGFREAHSALDEIFRQAGEVSKARIDSEQSLMREFMQAGEYAQRLEKHMADNIGLYRELVQLQAKVAEKTTENSLAAQLQGLQEHIARLTERLDHLATGPVHRPSSEPNPTISEPGRGAIWGDVHRGNP